MALRIGPFRLGSETPDPYWDIFINRPPADPTNLLTETIRKAPDGNIAPVRGEVHSPEIMSRHVKELADFFGACLVGIVRLEPPVHPPSGQASTETAAGEGAMPGYPFAIVCGVPAEYDVETAKGIGGQLPVLNCQFVTFNVASYLRELGYRGTVARLDPAALAVQAGLGELDGEGRFIAPKYGRRIHLGDPVLTDLPLHPDRG